MSDERERFELFCAWLMETLDREHGDWIDHAELADLRRWARSRWPLPTGAQPVMSAWARCFYNDHRSDMSQRRSHVS